MSISNKYLVRKYEGIIFLCQACRLAQITAVFSPALQAKRFVHIHMTSFTSSPLHRKHLFKKAFLAIFFEKLLGIHDCKKAVQKNY